MTVTLVPPADGVFDYLTVEIQENGHIRFVRSWLLNLGFVLEAYLCKQTSDPTNSFCACRINLT